jgi:hypothetical protein
MSRINFEDLVSDNPEVKVALLRVYDWMRNHNDTQAIDPKALPKEVQGLDPIELTRALIILVKTGYLRRVYKVLTPSGVFAEDEFEDPTKIPPMLPDRWERYFDTAESDVVPIFKKVA